MKSNKGPALFRATSSTDAGRKAEGNLAKRLKGRLQPASGAMKGVKGDIKAGAFLLESKSTAAQSMRVELHWLRKIHQEALEQNKKPALAIQFTDRHGEALPMSGSWVAIPEALFKELVGE